MEQLVKQMYRLMTPPINYQSSQDSQNSQDTQHSEPVTVQSARDAACDVQQALKTHSIQVSKSVKGCIQLNKELEPVAQAVSNVQLKLQDYEYLAVIRDHIASIRSIVARTLRRQGWDILDWSDVAEALKAEEESGSEQVFTQATMAAVEIVGLSWLDWQQLREVSYTANGMMHRGNEDNIDDALKQLDKKLPPRLSHTCGALTRALTYLKNARAQRARRL